MSKIGKLPVNIKEGVTVNIENNQAKVIGSNGTLLFSIPNGIVAKVEDNKIIVSQKGDKETTKALFGLVRASLANMVKGVSEGFERKLELSGVGFRVQITGNDLVLSLGFSHPVKVAAPEGIKFAVGDNIITVSGADKTLVGDVASKIRGIRPPDPYKGKGISYKGEKIRRKAGKAAKTVGGK